MTSLFGGGSSVNVNASGTLVPQQFTPTDGQTLFTLTLFTYTPNTNSLLVFINGNLQVPGVDYLETSAASFTLTSPVTALDAVRVIGFPLASFFQAGVGSNLTDIPTMAVVQASAYAWLGTVTGTNTYVGTAIPAPASVVAGLVYRFIVGVTNTAASTLNGVAIKKMGTSGLTDVSAGDLVVSGVYQAVFDGTVWQLSGGVGGGGDSVGSSNSLTLTNGLTVPASTGQVLVGPITVPNGKQIVVPSGSRLVIL